MYNGCYMEGNKKNRPRALLIFGAPCSGKTTFAEKFGNKFGLAYYDCDAIAEENGFSRQTILTILELVLRTKQTIIIEGGLDSENDRTEMRNMLRKNGYDPALVWIQTDVSTIRARLKSKFHSVAKAKEVFESATSGLEAPAEYEKPIILSGKHTFETQTRHAITGLADLTESK